MSKLTAFLKPVSTVETRQAVVSKRFLNEDGSPAAFCIKTITGAENDALRARCTRKVREKGIAYEEFDSGAYNKNIMLACVVEPDFAAKELCDAYGVVDPLEVPGRMLTAGELNRLSRAIVDLNGFSQDTVEEEAKNS